MATRSRSKNPPKGPEKEVEKTSEEFTEIRELNSAPRERTDLDRFKEIDEIIARLTMQDETLHVRLEENCKKLDRVEKTVEMNISHLEKRLEEGFNEKIGQRERSCKISMSMIDKEMKAFQNSFYELTQGFKSVSDVVRGVNERTTVNELQINNLGKENEEIKRKVTELSEFRPLNISGSNLPIIQQKNQAYASNFQWIY